MTDNTRFQPRLERMELEKKISGLVNRGSASEIFPIIPPPNSSSIPPLVRELTLAKSPKLLRNSTKAGPRAATAMGNAAQCIFLFPTSLAMAKEAIIATIIASVPKKLGESQGVFQKGRVKARVTPRAVSNVVTVSSEDTPFLRSRVIWTRA